MCTSHSSATSLCRRRIGAHGDQPRTIAPPPQRYCRARGFHLTDWLTEPQPLVAPALAEPCGVTSESRERATWVSALLRSTVSLLRLRAVLPLGAELEAIGARHRHECGHADLSPWPSVCSLDVVRDVARRLRGVKRHPTRAYRASPATRRFLTSNPRPARVRERRPQLRGRRAARAVRSGNTAA